MSDAEEELLEAERRGRAERPAGRLFAARMFAAAGCSTLSSERMFVRHERHSRLSLS